MKILFENQIKSQIYMMTDNFIDLKAGDIHKAVGADNRMPSCCNAMRNFMKGDDKILSQPPQGDGSSVTIRYFRKNHPFKKIGLIACSKSKTGENDHTEIFLAQNIYTGNVFKESKKYCLEPSNGFDDWYILSDMHHLLDKNALISYYDMDLNKLGATYCQLWSQIVFKQLESKFDLKNDIFYIFGARNYYKHLLGHLNCVVFEYKGRNCMNLQTPRIYLNGGK
ncbi:hypothetical protein IJG44_09175 [bacterium]|nr:hypothetical protein [bacterium]